ncbi:hypothetical protein BZL30_6789 [Mycobacterium kansasii]|uniref:Uncharacterized protein n=1 Tax=Mycobacterium kansasii TaxID=1768 RepID=A0A1V3WR67_MYCKA|nr:hypothetical protein BZL30_6789 [Mycobacterium kansasii]OOK69587.1 hypothetical protein BZL29_5976 [Mycobacterium kansasii]
MRTPNAPHGHGHPATSGAVAVKADDLGRGSPQRRGADIVAAQQPISRHN